MCDVTLNGHKGQVTALKYNAQGGLLASGAQDTDIIIWDVAAESGLYRLRGHQDQVTDLVSCLNSLAHRAMTEQRILTRQSLAQHVQYPPAGVQVLRQLLVVAQGCVVACRLSCSMAISSAAAAKTHM